MTAVSLALEDQLLDLLRDPATMAGHITLPTEFLGSYDDQGRILVSRDGLRQYLHRRLWERGGGGYTRLDPHHYLLRWCDTWGCQNPTHFTVSLTPYRNTGRKCRNGHRYGVRDYTRKGTYECHICKALRAERRNTGRPAHHQIEAARQFCPYDHEYTPENTYRWTDPSGSTHRKCRACALIRKAGGDPADDVVAA